MANVTDDELEQKRKNVAKLREQIAAEESKRAERVQAEQNNIAAAQLDAEAARLESQLAQIKEASKAATVRELASGPLEQAKAEAKAAESSSPTVVPVDTNDDQKKE